MRGKFWQTLSLGWKSLALHKLRSALAILGILIGVTAVIWLVAMGEGVSYEAQQQIKDLGANNILIRAVKPPGNNSRGMFGGLVVEYGLLWDDLQRIQEGISTVKRAVPLRELSKEARYGQRAADIRLVGCTPEYAEINNLTVARGRFLGDIDQTDEANVCVVADEAALKLFGPEDPLGKSIQVDGNVFLVVGQTAHRSPTGAIGGSFSGQNYNLDVYIPLATLRARLGDLAVTSRSGSMEGEIVQLSQITVTVDDLERVDDTAKMLNQQLANNHPEPDYAIVVPKELLEQAAVLQMMFNVLLVLIAGIALLVGGIGIMNIMLATVTERTREIGIRRALGAKRGDIVQQFLTETVVLSGIGGLLGVGLGFLCGPAVNGVRSLLRFALPEVMRALPPNIQNLEPRLAWWSVVAAFAVSVLVGVAFGIYPARRAAMMDPIEALRHD